jgi:O-antigen/teichoic acid export membrane protein
MFLVSNLVYLFSGLLSQFHWIEQANFRFKGIFITNFIRQGLFFAYIAISYARNPNQPLILLHMVYMQAIAAAAATGVEYLLIRKMLRFKFQPKVAEMKRLFAYGKYAFGTSISSILSSTVDQMMLGALLSTAASAAFNVAVRIMNLVDIPTNAIAMIVFPQSARRMATDGTEAIKYLYEKSVGVLLAILVPCLFILFLFPSQIVHIIAGNSYSDTIPIVKVTIFYCLLVPFGRQFGTILDSIGRPKLTFLLVLFTAILNLSLNYILIRKLGAIGAAYATLTSNLIAFIIAQSILKKLLNVNTFNTFRHAVAFYPEFYNKYVKPRLTKTPHG